MCQVSPWPSKVQVVDRPVVAGLYLLLSDEYSFAGYSAVYRDNRETGGRGERSRGENHDGGRHDSHFLLTSRIDDSCFLLGS